ncbi:MAG TPA: CSLREA domain-containing protein, partial [Thermoanaerobaculia bacterium]|nr:CSLREA domain-containing protein [Thermoanaerobaculia bacterium]
MKRLLSIAVAFALLIPAASAATFTVNSANDVDDGSCDATHCSLREAINAANGSSGADAIAFSIGSGAQTIVLTSLLPALTDSVTIDGTTQPGYTASPLIEIDATGLAAGIELNGGSQSSTIRGLIVHGASAQISVTGSLGSVAIEGNYVGTDATGNSDGGAGVLGIEVNAATATAIVIGGSGASQANVVGGNTDNGVPEGGIALVGVTAGSLIVEGNSIGIGADGTTAVPNSAGLSIDGTTSGCVIRDNVIGGNTGMGIDLITARGHAIEGNLIGVLADGSVRANGGSGIFIHDTQGFVNTIGGSTASQRNVISGNAADGINFFSSAFEDSDVVIQGNYIGVGPDGTSARGNGAYGIALSDPGDNSPWAHDNTIGGSGAGEGNVIAFNSKAGVLVDDSGSGVSIGNRIEGNSIYSNGGLGIDLAHANGGGTLSDAGVTANDAGDIDIGLGNHGQNFPILTSATSNGSSVIINGTLSSKASRNYRICAYGSPSADPSGYGEGESFLGCTTILTDGSGNGTFILTTAPPNAIDWVS